VRLASPKLAYAKQSVQAYLQTQTYAALDINIVSQRKLLSAEYVLLRQMHIWFFTCLV